MGVGIDTLDVLDAEIDRCLDQKAPEDILIKLYIDFWRTLKQRVGNSSGFSGVSEYLIFRYVLKRIEQQFGAIFTVEQCTPDTCIFSSEFLLLTSDLVISKFDPDAAHQRTDIALFARDGKLYQWRIVGAFEIKIGIGSPTTLNDMLTRFTTLLSCSQVLVFAVVFNSLNVGAQYKIQLGGFCERSNGRASVISKSDLNYQFQIGLNQAIDKCLANLSGSTVTSEARTL
jgi:hypothetical protein